VPENLKLHYVVEEDDFTSAGAASGDVKKLLRQLGANPDVIRKVAISMYEGEINMVIHANGGVIDVEISPTRITMVLTDHGPGIPDVEAAMQEGFSTAPDRIRSLGFGAGMGLPNMKKYADTLKIDTVVGKGTTITMTVNMK
jgi:serine/threonine-protein kinase RsbT